jgi:putative FmdB family regulatory protein
MPIYEYQCTACGHTLEALQKMSEDALTLCPSCHKEALEKLVSATSFQLKGTGWYVTDFRNKNTGTSTTSTPSTEKTSTSTPSTDSTST